MDGGSGNVSQPGDRAAVEQAVRDLIMAVVQRRTAPGAGVVVEGAAGIGKTFLAGQIAASVPSGQGQVIRLAGEPGRRNDPFAGALPLLGGRSGDAVTVRSQISPVTPGLKAWSSRPGSRLRP